MATLAYLMGKTPHRSPLLRKARRLGYVNADDLLCLAVARGCFHYSPSGGLPETFKDCGREHFSNTELAVALISASQQGDERHIRAAAQLIGSPEICAKELSRLAQMERAVPILRHIAESGLREDDVGREFWSSLLQSLPETKKIPEGRLPHPSRFVSQPGWSPASRPPRKATWLRPHGQHH